ncbi:uncharacterized protein LOC110861252 isoform X1 [Folsomia candida]|uniref:uncharacterized protein LOC110861252 isoform X1 n=1 Tax=Folsomia candida TaxID=158441 RepID=UPI0016053614|nr:uncharacterized protein LOC110861252 isoform X1 [Folsomia candida]
MAREKEQVFFAERREFDHLAGKLGTRYLSSVMDELLRMKIISSLKGLKADIVKGLEEATCKIEELTPLCSASHQQDLQLQEKIQSVKNLAIQHVTASRSAIVAMLPATINLLMVVKFLQEILPNLIAESHDEIEEFILENMPDTDDLSRYQMLQQTCVQSMGHISNLRAARRSK